MSITRLQHEVGGSATPQAPAPTESTEAPNRAKLTAPCAPTLHWTVSDYLGALVSSWVGGGPLPVEH